MTNVLTFKIEIEGLEDKIWRKIEISDKKTFADLAYTILASFDSLAYHLYNIKYDNKTYDCMVYPDEYHNDEKLYDATATHLNNLNLKQNDKLIMTYDIGTPTTFIITFLKTRNMEKGHGTHYPYVIDGAGKGMLDDISGYELKEIVDNIYKKGFSDYDFTPGYERTIKYDYRNYDKEADNILLKGLVSQIKEGYENGE